MDLMQAIKRTYAPGAEQDPYKWQRVRENLPWDDPLQGAIAPLEHRDFVREQTSADPLIGLGTMVADIPYQLSKLWAQQIPKRFVPDRLAKYHENASPASMDQVFGAGEGFVQGVLDLLRR